MIGLVVIDSGTSTEPFLLDDDTGQCLIDPNGAEQWRESAGSWAAAPPLPGC